MAFQAGAIVSQLTLDRSKFSASVKAVQKQSKKLGGWVKKNSGQFKAMGLAAAAAGTAVLLVFKKMVKQYVEVGDMIHKMAIRTGFAAETLSELAYAADISGADLTMLEKGVKKMSKTIVDASYGLETYLRVFRSLGLEIEDLMKLTPEEQFLKIGAAIADMENQTLKTAAAVDVFGRAGTMLLPLFAEGAEGIAKLREEAHRLGIIFDEEAAAKAAALKDAQTALTGSVKGLSIAILNDLIPVLTDVTKEFTDWFVGSRKDADTWALAIVSFFEIVAKGAMKLLAGFQILQSAVFEMATGIVAVLRNQIENLIIGFGMLAKVGIPVKGILKDLMQAWVDLSVVGKGYTEQMEKHIEQAADIIAGFTPFFQLLDNISAGLKDTEKGTKDLVETIGESLLPAAREMGDVFDLMMGKALPAAKSIKGVLEGAVKEFEKAPEEIEETWEDVFWRTLSAATLFTSSLGSLFDQMTTNQMARIDAEYEAREAAIDNSMMTEKSKADAMERLNADIDKKRKKAERASAKRTKALSIMEAIVGTAAAVVQAMKAPFPLSLILPAIIGAMGAAQIALIAATPLPTLAKGGRLRRGEPGIVGEEGPELFAPDMGGTVIPMREGAGLAGLRPIYLTIAPVYQISTIDEVGVDEFMRTRGLPAIVDAIKLGIQKPELQDALRIK